MKRVVITVALLFTVLLMVVLFCPKPEGLAEQGYSRAFLDRNQQLLRLTLAEDQRYRLPILLSEVSPLMQQATILYEDQHYYQHSGVDIPALFRAFRDTYLGFQRKSGASTLTMQVARLHWKLKTRTIFGKIRQILRALQLNRHYSKQQILQTYFNLVSYGRNIEGIAAASLIYFNKPAADLSLPEALTLSVIPQNPVRRNPTTQRGFNRLLKARANLFKRWLHSHPQDHSQAVFLDLPLEVRAPEQLPFAAPHFVNTIHQQLPNGQHGSIDTTLDFAKQRKLETIVRAYIARQRNKGIDNATVMLLNYRSMEVEGLVGSANFFDTEIAGQVNGSTALRSPGSTLKPFIYALAMDQGLIHPMSLLKDTPKRFAGFSPENFDQRFLGPVFARDALIKSRNVPAVNLLAQLQQPDFYQLLLSVGIDHLKNREHYGLALALGGAELTMHELVKLYAMLANQGQIRPIKTVRDKQSDRITYHQRGLSAEASYLILDILKDNPPPTAYQQTRFAGQSISTHQIAWKTGTSYGFRDAWAIGVSGDYVVAVWVGNFNGQGNPAFVGRTAAGPLLFDIFQAMNSRKRWQQDHRFARHSLNLRKVAVCANTGDLPGRYCPAITQSWFIPGVSPIKVSTIHRAIPIDKTSGLRNCGKKNHNSKLKIYEFWPSDFQRIFQQAGLSLKQPPAFAAHCNLQIKSTSGLSPIITSPQSQITYVMQENKQSLNQLPLSAVVDAGVKQLYWFADNRYIGQVNNKHPLFWKPKSGHYTLKVVDDHGRSAQIALKIVSG